MFGAINKQFNNAKRDIREDQFILESVTEDVDEVLLGSDEDIDDVIDSDSVPEDAYRRVDALLDQIVEKADYDDAEAEELLDDGDDDDEIDIDEISDADLDALISEAVDGNLEDLDEGIVSRVKGVHDFKKAAAEAAKHKDDDDFEVSHGNTTISRRRIDEKDVPDEFRRKADADEAKNENVIARLRSIASR